MWHHRPLQGHRQHKRMLAVASLRTAGCAPNATSVAARGGCLGGYVRSHGDRSRGEQSSMATVCAPAGARRSPCVNLRARLGGARAGMMEPGRRPRGRSERRSGPMYNAEQVCFALTNHPSVSSVGAGRFWLGFAPNMCTAIFGPTSANFEKLSTKLWPLLARVGRISSKVGCSASFGQPRPDLSRVRLWSSVDQTSTNYGPSFARVWPSSTKLGETLAELGQTRGRF